MLDGRRRKGKEGFCSWRESLERYRDDVDRFQVAEQSGSEKFWGRRRCLGSFPVGLSDTMTSNFLKTKFIKICNWQLTSHSNATFATNHLPISRESRIILAYTKRKRNSQVWIVWQNNQQQN